MYTMNMKQLRAFARAQNRHGYSRLRKAELITFLRTPPPPRIIVVDVNGREITNAQLRREMKNTWLKQPRSCPHCSKTFLEGIGPDIKRFMLSKV